MIGIYTALALALAAPTTIDPLRADIAGVKLNDAPEAAEKAIQAAGYEVTKRHASQDFEQIVKEKVRWRRGEAPQWGEEPSGTRQLVARKASGEELTISFSQHPDGSRVSHIQMSVRKDRLEPAAFLAQVKQKYGEPSRYEDLGTSLVYCAPPAGTRCDRPTGLYGLPQLRAGTFHTNTLKLTLGSNATHDLGKQIDAEVDRRSPKASSAAF